MYDFYSDTKTKPSKEMLEYALGRTFGDEQKDEDPTTLELCERVASLLGKESAVFLPSGTMCNEIAISVQTSPGDEILGSFQVNSAYIAPVPESCKENPISVLPASKTPMSVEVIPSAIPSKAVKRLRNLKTEQQIHYLLKQFHQELHFEYYLEKSLKHHILLLHHQ